MENKTIKNLRHQFDIMFSKIPDFITSTDHLHYILWNAMLDCNSIIMKLVVSKALGNRQIASIINHFHDYIDAIITNTPEDLHLSISAYYSVILDKMLIMSEDMEQYEVCFNIKRFSDFYFNNNPEIL